MKKAAVILLLVLVAAAFALPGSADMNKYSTVFMDTFDTVISLIGYAENQETFNARADETHAMYLHLHKMFDTYNSYADEGIVSVYDVNLKAASEPVQVDPVLFGLLTFCKSHYELVKGQTNVAMGSVLSIWHEYREAGLDDPENAKLPPMADLQAAARHMNIDDLILDEAEQTVYFADPEMKLDVGAVAKGYATEIVSQMLLAGDMPSFIISAGGNVRCGQKPLDGRARWGVGIQDPGPIDGMAGTGYMDVLYLTNLSVVTSGDYQRYYTVDGERDHHLNDPDTLYTVDGVRYHHLIDPDTLYPGRHMRAVTIVTQDSGLADALSTAVFLMPYEQGRAFVEALDGVEAYWVLMDGSVQCTDGLRAMLASQGASSRD